jgi:hypothetical protein
MIFKRPIIAGLCLLFNTSAYCEADIHLDQSSYVEQLKRAKVFSPVDTEQFDFVEGIEGPAELQSTRNFDGSLVKPVIECDFIEPDKATQGGKSSKFKCEPRGNIDGIKKLKVKYDPAEFLDQDSPYLPPQGYNGEVYSEIAASRLLTGLGFKTDRMFPATVICYNCPEEPFTYITRPELRKQMKRVEKLVLQKTAIELKATGKELGVPKLDDQLQPVIDAYGEISYDEIGWGFDRVRFGEAASDDATESMYREALSILLAMLQHADNKPDNQRLICTDWNDKSSSCEQSYLVAQDLGALFGQGMDAVGDLTSFSSPQLSKYHWRKWTNVRVWNDQLNCKLKLNVIPIVGMIPSYSFYNTFRQTQTTREAKHFIVELLYQLSDEQLLDIFNLAQTDLRNESYWDYSDPWNPYQHKVTARNWVETFKAKRDELALGLCLNDRLNP